MGIADFLDLKAQYEREVLFAQAKVSVIDDLIAREEAKATAPIDEIILNVTETDTDTITDDINY